MSLLGEHTNAAGTQDSNSKGNIYNYAAKFDHGELLHHGQLLIP